MSIASSDYVRLGRRALPWFGLLCLSLGGAPVVHGAATSLLAPVIAPGAMASTGMLADGVSSSTGSERVPVVISIRDAATGDETEMVCHTLRANMSTDALLINTEAAPFVVPGLCESA